MKRRAIVLLVVIVGNGALACTELFDRATQCAANRDCEGFGAVCDIPRRVCVPRDEPASSQTTGASLPAPSTATSSTEAGIAARAPDCSEANKAKVVTSGEITGAVTLDCSKDWLLRGRVFVRSGAVLTIAAGTTIHAEKASSGTLVILPGARIVARGTKDAPIVFTSDQVAPAPGDWGGLIVLGAAPTTAGRPFRGDPELAYGGANDDDDSGALSFVRIEYGAFGLALAGVGRGTSVDSVEVRRSTDNAFTFEGGRVDAKHLVCQAPGDECFELQNGYSGRLQFLFGQRLPGGASDANGLLTDASSPIIYNATLCGGSRTDLDYGLVVRSGSSLEMGNAIVTGWNAGVDVRGRASDRLELRGTLAFDDEATPAYVEDATVTDATLPTFDDDTGFDEVAWFRDPDRGNAETDPGLGACAAPHAPRPYPKAPLTTGALAPPTDGFFEAAPYIGAFRDTGDSWMRGDWVRFSDE